MGGHIEIDSVVEFKSLVDRSGSNRVNDFFKKSSYMKEFEHQAHFACFDLGDIKYVVHKLSKIVGAILNRVKRAPLVVVKRRFHKPGNAAENAIQRGADFMRDFLRRLQPL